MSDSPQRLPILDKFYQEYLTDENSPKFMKSVSDHYSIATIERLCQFGPPSSRRAATLAIGFLGNYSSNKVIGAALQDKDRAVRLLADHGIRRLWFRQGDQGVQHRLANIQRLNVAREFDESIEEATRLICSDSQIAETWNQRAVGWYNLGEFTKSLTDCRRCLKLNHYHFSAAVGVGHAFLQLENPRDAIKSFQQALAIHPGLDSVRAQMKHLKRNLGLS